MLSTPGRHVREAVEIILRRSRAPALEIHRLGTAGESAAPEVHARHLAEQIADGRGVSPLDRVAVEDDPGERRAAGRRVPSRRQYRDAHALFLLRREELRGVVDRIARERIGGEGVVEDLGVERGEG